MNIGFVTVSEDSLMTDVGGTFVKFHFVAKRGAVAIVEVTSHGPANNFATVKALGFELDRNTSGELLWIHYCGNVARAPEHCSKNGYVRR